jgi:hypothetical protein
VINQSSQDSVVGKHRAVDRLSVLELTCDMSGLSFGLRAVPNSGTSIRVLLADDSEIVRRAIRQVLPTQSGIAIVGEAADLVKPS